LSLTGDGSNASNPNKDDSGDGGSHEGTSSRASQASFAAGAMEEQRLASVAVAVLLAQIILLISGL